MSAASSNATLAALALDAIRGGQEAQRLIHRIRQGVAGPDDLLSTMREVFATGNAGQCEGFAREVQKQLERAQVCS